MVVVVVVDVVAVVVGGVVVAVAVAVVVAAAVVVVVVVVVIVVVVVVVVIFFNADARRGTYHPTHTCRTCTRLPCLSLFYCNALDLMVLMFSSSLVSWRGRPF